jgi:aryl-alcohol dehydrogenase-like predicted oxidoreductase
MEHVSLLPYSPLAMGLLTVSFTLQSPQRWSLGEPAFVICALVASGPWLWTCSRFHTASFER